MFSFAEASSRLADTMRLFRAGTSGCTVEGAPSGVARETWHADAEDILHELLKHKGLVCLCPLRSQAPECQISAVPRGARDGFLFIESTGAGLSFGREGESFQLFLQYVVDNRIRYYVGEAQLLNQFNEKGLLRGLLKLTGPLLQGQRRRFMRVKPPASMIQVVDVRCMSPTGPRQMAEGGATTPSATCPTWFVLPAKRILVSDISAGGLRAEVPAGEVGAALMTKGSLVLLTLHLLRRQASTILLMVLGVVLKMELRSVPGQGSSKVLSVVFQYQAEWPKSGGPQQWVRINPGLGVTCLLPWINEVQFATQKRGLGAAATPKGL